MKRQTKSILLALTFLLALTGCGKTESSGGSDSGKPDSSSQSSSSKDDPSKDENSSQAEQIPASEPKYLDLDVLDGQWEVSVGKIKDIHCCVQPYIMLLTEDNRLMAFFTTKHDDPEYEAQVPDTVVGFADVSAPEYLTVLEHTDGTCSVYRRSEDTFKLLYEGLKLPDNCLVYFPNGGSSYDEVRVFYSNDTGVVMDTYSTNPEKKYEGTVPISLTMLDAEEKELTPDFQEFTFMCPRGYNYTYVVDPNTGDLYAGRNGGRLPHWSYNGKDAGTIYINDEPFLKDCDQIYREHCYGMVYSLRNDPTSLYITQLGDYLSFDHQNIVTLTDGYTTSDIQEIFHAPTKYGCVIRMKDQKIYSAKGTSVNFNPELNEFFNSGHVVDVAAADDEIYILMDDNCIYVLDDMSLYVF
ncbi:MAG: hypothetical protein E7502_06435 [Ruminococcus sp.]|nr:hypothetical protein [Ruminococcus sp.]